MTFTWITVRADQMGGVPRIRGLRTVVGIVADGMAIRGSWRPIRTLRPRTSARACCPLRSKATYTWVRSGDLTARAGYEVSSSNLESSGSG